MSQSSCRIMSEMLSFHRIKNKTKYAHLQKVAYKAALPEQYCQCNTASAILPVQYCQCNTASVIHCTFPLRHENVKVC